MRRKALLEVEYTTHTETGHEYQLDGEQWERVIGGRYLQATRVTVMKDEVMP